MRGRLSTISTGTVLFVAILPFSTRVEASQVHFHDVDLDKVVERANLIVIAKALDPLVTTRYVDLHAGGSKAGKGKKTRVPNTRYHFKILRVLKNEVSERKAYRNKTIAVEPSDEGLYRSMVLAHLEGRPVPSPIVSRYPSQVVLKKVGKHEKLILFLSWYPPAKNPRFTMKSSYEKLRKLGEVRRLLRAQRSKKVRRKKR